jgi:hypothetical protein
MPAALMYSRRQSFKLCWQGISCRLRPFSCSRTHRAVVKTDERLGRDRADKPPWLVRGEDRCLADGAGKPRPPDEGGGVDGQELAHDQPVEEMPQGRELLLDALGLVAAHLELDPGRDMHRFDVEELADTAGLGPVEKVAHGPQIRLARVAVSESARRRTPGSAFRPDHRRARSARASPRHCPPFPELQAASRSARAPIKFSTMWKDCKDARVREA